MRVQTSFYMHIANFAKLLRASERTGKSLHNLIIELMYNYAKDYKFTSIARGTVKYQTADSRKNWRFLRISLQEEDYELFTDMRKVMKKSVSYLVALAIKKYLDNIISKILNNVFNYTSLTYYSGGERIGSLQRWKFTWMLDKKRI